MVKFEVAISNSFGDIPKKSFRDGAAAEADIDDSIKRKRFRVSLNEAIHQKRTRKVEQEAYHKMGQGKTPRRLIRKRC